MTDMEYDRISCLPDHVIDKILSFLPIRDAVRTSVLARNWRHKWTTIQDLVFKSECILPAATKNLSPSLKESKLLRAINHVLLLHSGTMNRFCLWHSNIAEIDWWNLFVTRKSIKEYELNVGHRKPYYKIPPCIFFCQGLHRLALFGCRLKPPSTFQCLRNLKSLELGHFTVARDDLENLISSSPLLQRLTLLDFDGFTRLNIHAPNLQFCYIGGEIEAVNFENTFQLATVSIRFNKNGHGNLLKFFKHLPQIRTLSIHGYLFKCMAAWVVPSKLPMSFINLSYISIHINLNNLKQMKAILCLFRSSPNLRVLELSAWSEENTVIPSPGTYSWEEMFSDLPDIPVRHVKIEDIPGTIFELDFIKFLLLYSPVLETMVVETSSKDALRFMKALLSFKRASKEAQIYFEVIEEDQDS